MSSTNIVVKTSTNMCIYGLHSVMGGNKDFCNQYFIWSK